MKKAPSGDDNGLKRGPWTDEEDRKLTGYIHEHGHGKWRTLPKLAGLNRCGKSCRLRWTNYLKPDIKRGKFSLEDQDAIIHLHRALGNKWSAIAACLPGRTDNEIKNFWNTNIKKKLMRMGIDPVTHIPRLDLLQLASTLTTSSLHHTSPQFMPDPVHTYPPNTLTYEDNYHYNPLGFVPALVLQNPRDITCPDQVPVCLNTRCDVEISYFENNVSGLGCENGDECLEMRPFVCEDRTELVPENSLVMSSEPIYGQTTLNDSWWPGSVYANGGVEGDKDWYCSNSGGFGSYQ